MEFHQWYLKSIKEAEERNQRDSEREAINNKEYGKEEGILDIIGDKQYKPSNIEDDLFRLDDDGGFVSPTFEGEEEDDSEWHVF